MTVTPNGQQNHTQHTLIARRLGVDTKAEHVVFMRRDCPVSRSEGFIAHNRVLIRHGGKHVIATLYQVTSPFLDVCDAGFSESAWQHLGLSDGDNVTIEHPEQLDSLSYVRSRIFGHHLSENALHAIIRDIVDGKYSDIHTTSFITACATHKLNRHEIVSLTHAMVDVGERLSWDRDIVVDKHSVGGLPGNRTTPIVVAIVAALGLTMPKTSSRAITSPAGTADTMETLAPVDLDTAAIHRVVEREGGCIAWGGAVRLSPADDILIAIERALDIDTEGQLVASILSKKIAAGATHLVIDMPVGPTAKVRTAQAAKSLTESLTITADAFGIRLKVIEGDGSQPIGRGIGPALEARDVVAVLRGAPDAPADLRARSLALSGALLELAGVANAGDGEALAATVLDDGRAWTKFQAICKAQGGMRVPPQSSHRHALNATKSGTLTAIDNRKISKLAKLAGAPEDKAAGVDLHVKLGGAVKAGEVICTVHAENHGELAYALNYAAANADIFGVG